MRRTDIAPTTEPVSMPDNRARTLVSAHLYAAIGIVGTLYAEVLSTTDGYPHDWHPDPEKLRDLAKRIARDGMAASRRVRKAAESLR